MRVRAGSPSNAPTPASMSVPLITLTLEPEDSGPQGGKLRAGSKRCAWTRSGHDAILAITGTRSPITSARYQRATEDRIITLSIRYTIDAGKRADFETYARSVAAPIERCGRKEVRKL